MNNAREQFRVNEIDLQELLTTLWANKLLIITITIIFGTAGIAYAFFAPQKWSAKAVVVAPSPTQLEQLQLRLDNLIALRDIAENNPIETNNHSDFLASFSETKLFNDFILAYSSFDNKSEFFKTNNYARQKDLKDADALQLSLEKWSKNISAAQKKNEVSATLSFGSDNAQDAEILLNKYLDFVQTKEVETKNKILADEISNQIKTLTLVYQAQEVEAFKYLQEEITRTEFALRISRTAGIEEPVENLNDQSLFAIDLGAKALSEKLKILREIKNPELFSPALAMIRLQLNSLQAIPQEKVSFTSWHFLKTPTKPLSRDWPKRFLVIITVFSVGLILGVMIVWLRVTFFLKTCKNI